MEVWSSPSASEVLLAPKLEEEEGSLTPKYAEEEDQVLALAMWPEVCSLEASQTINLYSS